MGISVLSLGIGGFEALVQENIKRLAAYTVIGLNGFSLAVLILGKVDLLLLFLTADLISAAGFSAIILSLRIGD